MDKKKCIVLLSFCVLMVFHPSSYAEEESPLGFTVEAQQAPTQIDHNQEYFYIKTEPGQEQQLKVTVVGTSEQPVKVKVYTANAITSESGTINYMADKDQDVSLKDSVEEITVVEESSFEIKKDEQKEVTIVVNPPKESYEGVKLGTVYFEQEAEEEKEKKQSAVQSSYSYRIGMVLTESEEAYDNSQSLNILSAKPNLFRAMKTVMVELQNPEPKAITKFNVTTQIVNASDNKILKTQKIENGSMAPNSRFNFAVDWGLDAIPAGDYIAKVEATSKDQSWTLEKKFSISKDEAKKMNAETLVKLTLPDWAKTAVVCGLLFTFLLIIVLSIRANKMKKIYKKKKEKKGKRRG